MSEKNDGIMHEVSSAVDLLARLKEISAGSEAMIQQIHQPLVFDAFLHFLADQAQEMMRAQVCTLLLVSPRERRLQVSSDSRHQAEEMEHSLRVGVHVPIDTGEIPQEIILQVICGYTDRRAASDQTLPTLLRICAHQIALIISLQQQSTFLTNESFSLELFTRLLQDPSRAHEWLSRDVPLLNMDMDLYRPHVFILADVANVERKGSGEAIDVLFKWRIRYLAELLYKAFPGSLLCYQRMPYYFVGLINVGQGGNEGLKRWLLPRIMTLHNELGHQRRIRIGIGGATSLDNPSSFRESFEQARLALEACLADQTPLDVLCYHPEMEKPDPFVSQPELALDFSGLVERVASYERKNAPDLLKTLEVFLKCGMSATEAARVLQIPHVSMRRRLERLQKLCAPYHLDLGEDPYLWFDGLYTAIKQYKDAHPLLPGSLDGKPARS